MSENMGKMVPQCPLLKKEKVIGDVITKTSKQNNKQTKNKNSTTFREWLPGCCKKLGKALKLRDATYPSFFSDTYKY